MPHNNSPALIPLLLAGLISNLAAVGFRLPHQDPEAIARGNAFTATADNPSAIYYNPAGITQLEGHQASIGLYAISAGIDFTSPSGGSAHSDQSFQYIPQVYYTYSPQDSKWSYGVGLFAPFGLGIDYGRDTPFPTVGIEAELALLTLNPTLAYQVTPEFSLGLGLALNYSDLSITRSIGLAPGDEFSYEGDDFSVGFNLGALWQANDQWSFGLNFRSATEMNYKGKATAKLPTGVQRTSSDGSLDFPLNIALGASYRPTPQWNIEVGLDWTDWDSVNTTTLQDTPFGDVPFPFLYESTFTYQLGITRSFESGHYLSLGYAYTEQAAPNATFSPLNPESNLHLMSVGVGHRGDISSWALSYTVGYNGGREVKGNQAASLVGENSDGTYDTLNHAVNLSYRFSF